MVNANLRRTHVAWVTVDTAVTAGLSFGAMLILARLVGPAEFAKAAIVLGATQLVNLFVEGLFHDALIQRQDVDSQHAGAALVFVILIALAIFVGTVTLLVVKPNLFGSELDSLLASSFFSLLFSGPLGVASALARKKFDFALVARASVAGKLFGCATGITMAALGGGALSLVWQYTSAVILQSGLTVWPASNQITLNMRFVRLVPLLRFALPFALMHSLVASRIQGFTILAATLMGLATAGYLNVAFRLTTTIQVILTTSFNNLAFPLLARHQAVRDDLLRTYRLVSRMIVTATLPALIGLSLVADDFVRFTLGSGWERSVSSIRIISVVGAIAFLRLSGSLVLRALGYVRYSFWNAAFQLVATIGGMSIYRPNSELEAVLFWILPMLVQLPLTFAVIKMNVHIGLREQLSPILPAMLATGLMTVTLMALSPIILSLPLLFRLAAEIFSGAFVYVGSLLLLDRDLTHVFRTQLMQTLKFRK
ncbi:O-antigen/teichoic acid export membrane protein [Bradyrhizobium sp. LB9.1b]